MNRKRVKITIAVALAVLSPKVVLAQDIIQIAKSDPLIITGAIGTQNTYYHSSIGDGYASPLSNMFYANLNISVYGFSMPFSLIYTNDNLDFNYPHISFNLTPKYKKGDTTMNTEKKKRGRPRDMLTLVSCCWMTITNSLKPQNS